MPSRCGTGERRWNGKQDRQRLLTRFRRSPIPGLLVTRPTSRPSDTESNSSPPSEYVAIYGAKCRVVTGWIETRKTKRVGA